MIVVRVEFGVEDAHPLQWPSITWLKHDRHAVCRGEANVARLDTNDLHLAVHDDIKRGWAACNGGVHGLQQVPARGQDSNVAVHPLGQANLVLS